jgi:phosphate:Na+ symporter
METLNSILKLSAGVGLFLFAMYLVEESLKNLSGRNFKLFLQRITKNNITAVAGGTIVTGILQSSSMVSLMVLAFVGAGVFNMKNALAIILGANLGTTLASWMVATIGFKTDIEVIAYPAVCLGGFLLILLGNRKTIKYVSYFLLGFGLLFIGLSFMKSAMETQVQHFDFSQYASKPLLVFLIIGFLITVVVQSSSVTMALTLSALNAGAIEFPMAAAIVLGSETGTIIKIILSATGGNAAKKRVALGNLLFNIFITAIAFILLKPIILLITDIIKIKDPLIGLVTFSSLINLLAIVLFLPVLNLFAAFLERFFKNTDGSTAAFINHASVAETKTALDLFQRETRYFIHNSMLFNLELFKIHALELDQQPIYKQINHKINFDSKTSEEKYEFLKQLQGELQAFYLKLRVQLNSEEISELNQLIAAVRSAMHAVKSIKDIQSNISNLSSSSQEIKYQLFLHHKKETQELYIKLNTFLSRKEKLRLEELKTQFETIQKNYTSILNTFYTKAQLAPIEDIDITNVINFNRELFTSNKAMLMAVKDILLDEKQALNFNEIPTYKT